MGLKLSSGRPSARKEAMQALIKDDSEAKVRINFELDRSEHRALKLMATQSNTTIAQLLRSEIKRIIASSHQKIN